MHLLEASTLTVAFSSAARQKLAAAALELLSGQRPQGTHSRNNDSLAKLL